jgi:L-alanine-DL-glutamate epimerase-like enolase superfamily enzyme
VPETFTAAWLEDPAITNTTAGVLRGAHDRLAWDDPLHDVDDLDRLGPVGAVNVKPSRLGGLAALLALVTRRRESRIAVCSGGQSEIGAGRGQVTAPGISSRPPVHPRQLGFG